MNCTQSWLVSVFYIKAGMVASGEGWRGRHQPSAVSSGSSWCWPPLCVSPGFLMLPLELWWLTRMMGPLWLRLLVFSFKPSLHPKKSSGLFWSVWEECIRLFTKLPGTFPLRRQSSSLHPVFSCASNKMSLWHTEHGVSLLFCMFPLHDIFHLT